LLPDADPVQKVTIVSRGQMGGYTRMTPDEDRKMWSLPQFKAAMASALGGHVAEELVFGQVTTGASNDLRKAYSIARAMVCDYGMSPVLGALAVGSEDEGRFYRGYGEHLAEKIDQEQHRLVDEARTLAIAILEPRLADLKKASEELLETETIDGAAMARLFGPRPTTQPQLPAPPIVAALPTAPAEPIPLPRPARGGWRPALAVLPFTLSIRWRRRRGKQSPPTLAEY
jgi:cell division protease FtsH